MGESLEALKQLVISLLWRAFQLFMMGVGMVIFYDTLGTVEPSGYNVFGSLTFGFFTSYFTTMILVRVIARLRRDRPDTEPEEHVGRAVSDVRDHAPTRRQFAARSSKVR